MQIRSKSCANCGETTHLAADSIPFVDRDVLMTGMVIFAPASLPRVLTVCDDACCSYGRIASMAVDETLLLLPLMSKLRLPPEPLMFLTRMRNPPIHIKTTRPMQRRKRVQEKPFPRGLAMTHMCMQYHPLHGKEKPGPAPQGQAVVLRTESMHCICTEPEFSCRKSQDFDAEAPFA